MPIVPVPVAETGKDVKRKLTRVVRTLEEKYGPHIYPDDGPQDPVEQIVFAVLAARNPVTNARKAIRDMKEEYIDWNEVRVATVRQLEETLERARIEPAGRMAETIKAVLMKTFDEVCRVSLEVLRSDGPERARKVVAKLDVLEPHEQQYLLVAAGVEEAPPLDPATDRIGERLGIFAKDDSPARRRKLLESHVASSDALRFHHLMAEHGKKLCTATDPKCAKCPAQQECDWFKAAEAARKAEEKERAKAKKEKGEKGEKPEKPEKRDRAEKGEKSEKGAKGAAKKGAEEKKGAAKKEKGRDGAGKHEKGGKTDGARRAEKAKAAKPSGKAKGKPAGKRARASSDDDEE
jgi:endonuclease-3